MNFLFYGSCCMFHCIISCQCCDEKPCDDNGVVLFYSCVFFYFLHHHWVVHNSVFPSCHEPTRPFQFLALLIYASLREVYLDLMPLLRHYEQHHNQDHNQK